jgi:two-component system, chemotaxis family, chemotaxis protein CheY
MVRDRRCKVLVVDDSAVIRRQVAGLLVRQGLEVLQAESGCSALGQVEREGSLGLIICDVQMPEMNGLQLLEHLANQQRLVSLPFVLLTSEVDPEAMLKARELGARGWLVKPIDRNQLILVTKKLLGREGGMPQQSRR